MSIRVRFMVLIAVIGLIASLSLAIFSYYFNKNNLLNESKSRGNLVFNYMQSSRAYFANTQLPKIYETVGRDEFVPELMSGFAVTRGIFKEFSKKNPDFIFKQATINPLVETNKADSQEIKLINDFRKKPKMADKEGTIKREGKDFFFFAKPIRVKTACLQCHGDPKKAPEELVDTYGSENGYNWKDGDTIAALIVYVPIQEGLDRAKRLAAALFCIGTAIIMVVMLLIWVFFSRYIVKPIVILDQRATEISLGKNLNDSIVPMSKDEIGSLARAIDRMRISVEKMLQRYQ